MANPFLIRSAKPEEIDLCYGKAGEQSRPGCIGYLRGDFGRSGNEFWSNWFGAHDELNIPEFKQEFDAIINGLRDTGLLKSRTAMQGVCSLSECKQENSSYHFLIETKSYLYCFRCMTNPGDYNFYVFPYRKDQMQHEQQHESLSQEEQDDGFKLDL